MIQPSPHSQSVQWHRLTVDAALDRVESRPQGLGASEVQERLMRFGPNELVERGARTVWHILGEQFKSVMVVVLIVAGVISLTLGEFTDAAAIIAIVVLNAILGVMQEYRAEKAMQALKSLAVPVVRVRREGHVLELPARNLVPGDVVLLEAGSHVPADGRLLEAVNLRVQEATLTGESEPVEKHTASVTGGDVALGDRRNMAYRGTAVVAGRGVLLATDTGMRTELGRIAEMLQSVQREPTPLQKRLEQLAKGLAVAALVVVAVVFGLGMLRGEPFRLMFMVAVSMAVAAVPEGLPAVVTIALTLGARRMLARKALIRRLNAVETLGSVTVICSDKTGTLTENRMTVTALDVAGHRVDLRPDMDAESLVSACGRAPALTLLLAGSALCNDAVLERDDAGRMRVVGDPTEGALVAAAARFGLVKADLEAAMPRVAEVPFSSERKRMSTVHRLGEPAATKSGRCLEEALTSVCPGASHIAFTKGAVDVMLGLSQWVWADGRAEPMDPAWRARIAESNDRLAGNGMRVLGLAFRTMTEVPAAVSESEVEQGLVFVGLAAMIDPARPEVRSAVAECRAAGIRPVMITGDHPLTARYIGAELGIESATPVVTGTELARMDSAELTATVKETAIYARVAPEHKLRIVEALQQQGQIVAMTGDGVNDAPALRKADIGVAMGITGTDVSKEAADIVLLDDNFATIVAAVREGRAIYDNIRKFIKYILAANTGEIWVMLAAPLLGMPLPLLPLQILWINLVTDGLPSLALSVERPEHDVMKRPPNDPRGSIFGQGLGVHIIWVGFLMAAAALGMGYWAWRNGDPGWRTMVFTTVTLSQLFHTLVIRSFRVSIFHLGFFSNPALAGTILATLALQMAVVYVPFLQGVFKTVAMAPRDLLISLLLSFTVFWGVELEKFILRARDRRRARAA
ncbi:MAG: cation-translocating P-type ATPase [candidate division WOR-3 bacterium]|nr:cation-translocating P-type ATPase [candidate division WOR-3 bacterium]